MKKRTIL